MYGDICASLVVAWICRRVPFSDGTPASRARAMFRAGRSSGRPSRLLRSVSVTNSSSSLPTCDEEPIATDPAAFSGVSGPADPPLKNSGGLRNAFSRGSELSDFAPNGSTLVRATVSSSMECPKR